MQPASSSYAVFRFIFCRICYDTLKFVSALKFRYIVLQFDKFGKFIYIIVLPFQTHTDYTVTARDILIYEKCQVVFVTIISNWMFYSYKCGIHQTRTVIAQWFKAHLSHIMVVRSNQLVSIYFFKKCQTLHTSILAIRQLYKLYVLCFCVWFVFALPNRILEALDYTACN